MDFLRRGFHFIIMLGGEEMNNIHCELDQTGIRFEL